MRTTERYDTCNDTNTPITTFVRNIAKQNDIIESAELYFIRLFKIRTDKMATMIIRSALVKRLVHAIVEDALIWFQNFCYYFK